ncbi:DUF2059 domain-containing protein [Terrihabitans rhizophilus]|jgi:hypothetical protein|uniref:DUF2059 domain-containing protein n=1 Tax=Terrihabitans rhizophilus TaxID=3092662 RepID=A0ABU4RR95_9HYPH|nr:DUF2059 domain-containing protein [Terrihabitans sp. PJ23]MDX6806619.1 DUF2059 domain-containing protein [Terrihabitans sp. PJ23]
MLFPFVRRAGCALLIAGSLAAPAFAQTAQPTPEHLALARAVLDFTGAGTSFDGVVPKLLEDARNVILRTRPTLQADLDAAILQLNTKLANRDEELLTSIAKVYASKFSEAELKEIAGFYQSPTGQKMTAALPDVLRESFVFAQDWSRRMSVEVMSQIRAEMAKKGHEI